MPKRRLLSDEDIVALLFQESDDEADDLIIFGDNTINIFRIHEFYLSYSSKASSSEVRHDKYSPKFSKTQESLQSMTKILRYFLVQL